MIAIIKNKNIWLTFSSILVGASILSMLIWGLNLGIDFTGGSLLEVNISGTNLSSQDIQTSLKESNLVDSANVQITDQQTAIIRFQDVNEENHQDILKALEDDAGVALEELRFESVGPVIGNELKQKSIYAILIVLIAIIGYVAWAFRRVSWPVESWKYGLTAIITLFHDILIVVGIFSILGVTLGVEVNTAFIVALLTILGYSVNDTIVIFDRIRENLAKRKENFGEIINISVNETMLRSLNTSISTLLVLLAIFFVGGETTKYFILTLILGIIVGTYSSIFVASPILTLWHKLAKK